MPDEAVIDDVPSLDDVARQFNESAASGKPIQSPTETAPEVKEAPVGDPPAAKAPKVEAKAKADAPKEEPKTEAKEQSAVSKLLKKDKPAVKEETPAEKQDRLNWQTAPKEFRERHEQLLTEHKTTAQKAAEYEKRVTDYEQRIKDIEAKSGDTSKADLKLVEEYTSKIANYEATLRELDYKRSKEYTEAEGGYQERYNQRYAKANAELKEFQVITGKDEVSGEVSTRTATESDFRALLSKSIGEQRRLTREMFGPDADVVNRHLDALRDIQDEANFNLTKKLEDARKHGEIRQKEQKVAEQKQQQEYQQQLDTFKKQIETEWPDVYTAPADDKEGAEALEGGRELVKAALSNASNMTLQDRAAHNAVLEMRAAVAPYLEHRVNLLKAENESLLKELKAFRDSDPGAGGGRQVPTPQADDVGGIDAMAKVFNEK